MCLSEFLASRGLALLWAISVEAGRFEEFTCTEVKASELWGKTYSWDGDYVDNTAVSHVVRAALQRTN